MPITFLVTAVGSGDHDLLAASHPGSTRLIEL
jgi:hypothetical protein